MSAPLKPGMKATYDPCPQCGRGVSGYDVEQGYMIHTLLGTVVVEPGEQPPPGVTGRTETDPSLTRYRVEPCGHEVAWTGIRIRVVDTLKHLRLTEREAEIVGHVALGMSNKEIAKAVRLSVHTVKTHLARISAPERYNHGDRTRIVTLALAAGEIVLPATEVAA